MVDLPDVKPTDILTSQDLVEVITGLSPGWYRSRDLHPRYKAWAESQHREVREVGMLGQMIGRTRLLERRTITGGIALWHVTENAITGRDWFTEPKH